MQLVHKTVKVDTINEFLMRERGQGKLFPMQSMHKMVRVNVLNEFLTREQGQGKPFLMQSVHKGGWIVN